MAEYKTDLKDIYFNLFDVLNVQEFAPDLGEDGLKDIIREYDKFVGNEVYPCRQTCDVEGVHLVDGKVKAPESLRAPLQNYYANGWFGLGQPEDVGGMPAPHAVSGACTSLSCGANISFEMYAGLSRAAFNVIRQIGTDAQKAKYLEKMITGSWGGTMCLTESGAGSDVGAATTTATPMDNGNYAIKGVKIFISSGESDYFENNIHLVLARTPGSPEGTKGLSLFIVPRFRINQDGTVGDSNDVICTKVEEKMGIHGSATCELTFGQNGVCEGELIGKEHEGMPNMFLMMNEARLMCAVQGESQANLCTMLTLQYANERSQFGSEIIKMPDVKRMLMKMRSISRGMRALCLYTANLFDKEKTGGDEVSAEIALLTPICKSWCTDEGFNVSIEGIQVHGGYGFCSEYGMEQFARDLKIASIYEGTNGIQAIDFVMRKIMRDKGQAFTKLAEKIMTTMKNPAASEWQNEVALMGKSLEKGQAVLQKFGQLAQENKIDLVLEHCMNFLNFSGNLVVAWQLLEHAILSKEKLAGASGDDKQYYQSKIDDFQFFCQHKLTQNAGLSHLMLNWENDLTSVVL